MRRTLTLTLAAGIALAGTAADARGAEPRIVTRANVEQRVGEMFGRMDVNGDGRIDAADRGAARRQAFERIDTDGNGELSVAEFEARRTRYREARAEGEAARRPGFARRGRHGIGPGLAHSADADGDGVVSQEEFASAALARFDRLDADGDGTISLEESREARQQMRHHMRRGRQGRDAG